MKKALIAALASLMLAGALAGASDFSVATVSSRAISLSDGACPAPTDTPRHFLFGESTAH